MKVFNSKRSFNLRDYTSPGSDTSFYKGIPVEFRSRVRAILKSKGYKGSEIRFEYRGSRKHSMCARSTLLENANTFAVYRRD